MKLPLRMLSGWVPLLCNSFLFMQSFVYTSSSSILAILLYLLSQANDVLMFRTSIPGHKDCDLHNGVYRHYGEYCPRIVNGAFWHWWGELPPYNDYAIRIINEWNLLNTVKSGPDIELLDPWMMTVLRPDGHFQDRMPGRTVAWIPKSVCCIRCQAPLIGGITSSWCNWRILVLIWRIIILCRLGDRKIHKYLGCNSKTNSRLTSLYSSSTKKKKAIAVCQ